MDPRKQEIYISTDVEFDGENPATNSLLSIGAVAYREDGKELGRFSANMKSLPGHYPDPRTMVTGFWAQPANQSALRATQENRREPQEVMEDFSGWVKSFTGKAILVAQPLEIEERWLKQYFSECKIEPPFQGAICMRKYLEKALDMMRDGDPDPQTWLSSHPYTHIAIDDAVHQGETFMNMKKWVEKREHENSQQR